MSTLNHKNTTLLTQKTLLVIDAVKQHWPHVEGKSLHHLRITVPLDNSCSGDNLNDLVRKLVNSKQSRNCVDNRSWWNSNFAGGCYKIAIRQKTYESELEVVYDLMCLSEIQNLEGLLEELQRRLRKIFPKAKASVSSSVELREEKDFERMVIVAFGKISNPIFESESFKLLDGNVKHWLFEAVGKDVRLLGMFYLMLHEPYNL